MVMCFVPDCKHYNERDNCQYFKFPRDEITKEMWIRNIRRADRPPSKYSVVCSCHFKGALKENGPSIFPGRSDQQMFKFPDTHHNVPKDINKKLKLVGHIPERKPRGQASAPSFKDFMMSKEISEAQSKLTETCDKLAVLHKRRLKLRASAMSKQSNLSGSSTTSSLLPAYETYFAKKPSTTLLVQPIHQTNLSSEEQLSGSSEDPAIEENVSSDEPLNNSSVDPDVEGNVSSDESSSDSTPKFSDESSSSSWHPPREENVSSDESLADSPLPPSFETNLSSEEEEEESQTTSQLHKSNLNLSSDKSAANFPTFMSSSEKAEALETSTDSVNFKKLLAPLDKTSSNENCYKLSSSKYALPSSDKSSTSASVFKFKHRIPPSFVKKEDSSIAKHIKKNDVAHNYYLETIANDKSLEGSDALFSSSFRWEIANYKSKLNDRFTRAQKEKKRLSRMLYSLRQKTSYWKQKNAALKIQLDKQESKRDTQ